MGAILNYAGIIKKKLWGIARKKLLFTDKAINYFPLNLPFRFSRKAETPSFLSSVVQANA